jgi:hypothetical protein
VTLKQSFKNLIFIFLLPYLFFPSKKRKKSNKEQEKEQAPLDCEQKQFSGKYRFYKNW